MKSNIIVHSSTGIGCKMTCKRECIRETRDNVTRNFLFKTVKTTQIYMWQHRICSTAPWITFLALLKTNTRVPGHQYTLCREKPQVLPEGRAGSMVVFSQELTCSQVNPLVPRETLYPQLLYDSSNVQPPTERSKETQ